MKKYLLVIPVLLAGAAWAATVTVQWENPTQNTDNSTIPATGANSIASTRVEYGTCNGALFGTKLGEFVAQGKVETAVSPDLGPGTYCARAFTKNVAGVESDASNVAQKVIPAAKPKPPSNFSFGS